MNRAQSYREKTQAAREVQAKEIPLPSGMMVLAARIDLVDWLSTGMLPQVFVEEVLKIVEDGRKPTTSEVLRRAKGKAIIESLIFMRNIVQATLVSPRLVMRPDPEKDEIAPHELTKEDFAFIFQWQMAGAPDIPVPMKGGKQTSVGALRKFRRRRAVPNSRADKQKVRTAA